MKKKILIPVVILAVILLSVFAYVFFMRPLVIPIFGGGDSETVGKVTMRTEFPVYDKSCSYVTVVIENNSGEYVEFGSTWSLEKKVLGSWMNVPFRSDVGFTSILNVLESGGAKVADCNLTLFHGAVEEGRYRIAKTISDTVYYAEFQIGESEITAVSPFGYEPFGLIESIGYDIERAREDKVVFFEDDGIENEDKLLDFLRAVQIPQRKAQIRLAEINEKGELILTDIYRLSGGVYRVTQWNQDKYSAVQMKIFASSHYKAGEMYADEFAETYSITYYSYIVTNGKQLVLSNYSEYSKNESDLVFVSDERMTKALKDFAKNEWKAEAEKTYKLFSNDGLRSAAANKLIAENEYGFWVSEYNENGISTSGQTLFLNSDNLNEPKKAKIIGFVWTKDNALTVIAEDGKTDGKTNYYYEFRDPETYEVTAYTHSVHEYTVVDGKILIPE